MKPLILVSNDDGFRSKGIQALTAAMEPLGDVVVAAPDREQSAMSHAISLDRPLRATEHAPGRWAIDGTPADCAYLAMLHLCPRPPALVVSGINHGYNLGSDFFYSGTVAAAVEGALRGTPAIAFSMQRGEDEGFEIVARFARELATHVLAHGLPPQTLLSVNAPCKPGREIQGYRWTRLGKRAYRDQVDMRSDLRGRRYFWIGGPEIEIEGAPGTDCHAVQNDLISVTPLHLDLTHEEDLREVRSWTLSGFKHAK